MRVACLEIQQCRSALPRRTTRALEISAMRTMELGKRAAAAVQVPLGNCRANWF